MKTYTINEVARMSGLSARTIRGYIKTGFLSGEKIDGVWKFSREEVGELFANKAVSQSLRAKRNAVIYDFLLDDRKKNDEMCSILDLFAEEEAAAEISDFFCSKISSGEYSEMNFSFEHHGKYVRVSLTGPAESVLKILSEYYE